jgi:hypothetical protein
VIHIHNFKGSDCEGDSWSQIRSREVRPLLFATSRFILCSRTSFLASMGPIRISVSGKPVFSEPFFLNLPLRELFLRGNSGEIWSSIFTNSIDVLHRSESPHISRSDCFSKRRQSRALCQWESNSQVESPFSVCRCWILGVAANHYSSAEGNIRPVVTGHNDLGPSRSLAGSNPLVLHTTGMTSIADSLNVTCCLFSNLSATDSGNVYGSVIRFET